MSLEVLAGLTVLLGALALLLRVAGWTVLSLDRLRVQVRQARLRARRDGWGRPN